MMTGTGRYTLQTDGHCIFVNVSMKLFLYQKSTLPLTKLQCLPSICFISTKNKDLMCPARTYQWELLLACLN